MTITAFDIKNRDERNILYFLKMYFPKENFGKIKYFNGYPIPDLCNEKETIMVEVGGLSGKDYNVSNDTIDSIEQLYIDTPAIMNRFKDIFLKYIDCKEIWWFGKPDFLGTSFIRILRFDLLDEIKNKRRCELKMEIEELEKELKTLKEKMDDYNQLFNQLHSIKHTAEHICEHFEDKLDN